MNERLNTRAAGYARLSKADEGNIETQKEAIQRYCEGKGYDLRSILEERCSAYAPPLSQRDGWVRLNRGAEAFDVLVVYSIDRLTRSIFDGVDLLKTYEELPFKIEVINGDLDLSTPHGKMLFVMQLLFAWYESELISWRTKKGLERAKEKGKTLGRPRKRKGRRRVNA